MKPILFQGQMPLLNPPWKTKMLIDNDHWKEYYVPKAFTHSFSSFNVNPHSALHTCYHCPPLEMRKLCCREVISEQGVGENPSSGLRDSKPLPITCPCVHCLYSSETTAWSEGRGGLCWYGCFPLAPFNRTQEGFCWHSNWTMLQHHVFETSCATLKR